MYNEKQKMLFIKQYEENNIIPPYYLTNIMNYAEHYEQQIGKDLCDFNYTDIINYMKFLSKSSVNVLNNLSSKYRIYADWALENKMIIDDENHWIEIDADALRNCININGMSQKYLTRKEIMNLINQLDNARDKLLLCAPFEGLAGIEQCELYNMKLSDINENKVKLCTGRVVEFPLYFIEILKEAATTYEYYCINPLKFATKPFKDDDGESYVIKVAYNGLGRETLYLSLRKTLKTIKDYLGISPKINVTTLYMSGILDFIQEKAKELNVSVIEYVNNPNSEDIIKQKYENYNKYSFLNFYKMFSNNN